MPRPPKSRQCTNCGYSGPSEKFDKIFDDEESPDDDGIVCCDLRCPNCNTNIYDGFEFETEILEPKDLGEYEDRAICSSLQNLTQET